MSEDLLAHRLDDGEGGIVLLLNGGMMTWTGWEPVAARLRDGSSGAPGGYRLLGCDLRGQLRSPGLGHPRLDANVADLVALLDALGLDRVHVLGTSFGGEVGLLLAALHPARVHTLAAVTAVDRSPAEMGADSRRLQALVRDVLAGGAPGAFTAAVSAGIYSAEYRERCGDELATRRKQLAALPESWYRGLLGILTAIEEFDLTPWLGRITCPTLVVAAAADAVMPAERVRALAAAIAGAELATHPRSGHVLVLEDPQWLARTYREFLDRRAGEDA